MRQIPKQRGLTLVELMVAVALSLIVVFFITNIMLSSSRTSQQTEGIAQAQENGRFILNWLQSNARKAGFPGIEGKANERIEPFAPVCATTPSFTAAVAGQACTFEQNTGGGDRLAVRRTYLTVSANDADKQTCTGAAITGVTDGAAVIDVFWVNPNARTLWCATYKEDGSVIGDAAAIASDIESMHVLYGSEASQDDAYRSQVTRFTSYSEALTLSGSDWRNIRAVRIGVLTRSESAQVSEQAKRSYIVLDANPATFDDRIARHIQSTTIYLQNK